MTSFLIKAHENRAQSSWNGYKDCAFCRIIKDELPSFRVFENDLVVAVLDILPLRKGHTLVIPKAHFSRLSELPPEYAAAVGLAVTKVAHALTQEYAQAVPHVRLNAERNLLVVIYSLQVHYHVIPAPTFGKQPSTPMHQREFDGRTELDEEEGEILAKQIRSKL
ncbi:HIT-like protein [Mycena olivaceomarginata]|nr:HIT-like protein [Mycena olivaceomarginata]